MSDELTIICVIITTRNLYINSTHFVNFYNQNQEMSNEISNPSPLENPYPKEKKKTNEYSSLRCVLIIPTKKSIEKSQSHCNSIIETTIIPCYHHQYPKTSPTSESQNSSTANYQQPQLRPIPPPPNQATKNKRKKILPPSVKNPDSSNSFPLSSQATPQSIALPSRSS